MDEDYCPSELDEKLDDIEFDNDLSSGSCSIDQIEGILVGGYNTRFWMYRKHLINIPNYNFNKLPFYNWQCLTIQMAHRDVDLVIKSDKDMRSVLQYLVYQLQTVNG